MTNSPNLFDLDGKYNLKLCFEIADAKSQSLKDDL